MPDFRARPTYLGTDLATSTEAAAAGDASVATHAALSDPHTGYVLESVIDAAGDLLVGTADNAIGKLAKGTDGQVLTVDPSTHLLVWATPSSPTETLPATIIDAKGDLIAGTAADTAARLAAGTNGQFLTAQSGQTTGLLWATHDNTGDPHSQYATDTDLSTHAAAADPHTGYVLESLLDAKGDLIAASADNTPARVPVGSNGQVLTADSASTGGVKWAAAAASITVAETDGSPSVAAIDTIVVPEYTLTDSGSGDVSLRIPTFHMRWSAGSGVTKDGSDLVSEWLDNSPWARKFHQPTATNKPLYVASAINGQPVIRFDGTDNYLQGHIDGTSLEAWSIAIVVKCLAAETTEGILQWANALNAGGPWILLQRYDNAGTPSTRWQILGTFVFVTPHATNATRLYVVTYDGYNLTHSVDGVDSTAGAGLAVVTGRSNGTSIWLGNGFNGYANVDIGEVLIAKNYAWTAAERAAIQTALKTKYGIA